MSYPYSDLGCRIAIFEELESVSVGRCCEVVFISDVANLLISSTTPVPRLNQKPASHSFIGWSFRLLKRCLRVDIPSIASLCLSVSLSVSIFLSSPVSVSLFLSIKIERPCHV